MPHCQWIKSKVWRTLKNHRYNPNLKRWSKGRDSAERGGSAWCLVGRRWTGHVRWGWRRAHWKSIISPGTDLQAFGLCSDRKKIWLQFLFFPRVNFNDNLDKMKLGRESFKSRHKRYTQEPGTYEKFKEKEILSYISVACAQKFVVVVEYSPWIREW